MPAISKKDQIITHALTLFYQNGFNATGIDLIISEAGVSKKTLYNHFRSKDELILAVLRKRDEIFRQKLVASTEKLGRTGQEKLLALFDFMHHWFHEKDFFGCMFINASAEFSDAAHPSHVLCSEHKYLIREYIKSLAIDAKAKKPEVLSLQLNLLIEGAIVEAHVSGDKNSALRAKEMATIFIHLSLN